MTIGEGILSCLMLFHTFISFKFQIFKVCFSVITGCLLGSSIQGHHNTSPTCTIGSQSIHLVCPKIL